MSNRVSNLHSIKLYIAVGIGGIIGAVGRYSISLLFQPNVNFPYATLIVNLIGCYLLSFVLNKGLIKQRLSPEMFAALGTGTIGAFTTFSTFAVETIELWTRNSYLSILYVVISIFGGLGFCFLGYMSAKERVVQS
ncbi:fluoride efflux transporter FluC [Virgibacillus oceani]|uniref:Fluoride-specific ion channel FluC n=1 Tax=Virgibacillus oceani TaxID=1479511 RepID=A0A917LZV0_9BACI|nr:CrcB family protein [Virgibacillus oceani]GGG66701.1 chromosome condensation protein CcrB [Virgibacillus oceani]